MDIHGQIRSFFQKSIEVKAKILEEGAEKVLADMATLIANSILNGGKLLICGNGGSAADAQHLATELLVRLRPHVNRRGLPAIPLALDTSMLTACGNDLGFEHIFSRSLESLGNQGDVLLGITTSSRSPNVLKAFEKARAMGIHTLGFLGGTGEPANALCDLSFIVPTTETARIQEVHILAGHSVLEMVEEIILTKEN
jgi:D-sedoheptulose 7-phosphate isomerase